MAHAHLVVAHLDEELSVLVARLAKQQVVSRRQPHFLAGLQWPVVQHGAMLGAQVCQVDVTAPGGEACVLGAHLQAQQRM